MRRGALKRNRLFAFLVLKKEANNTRKLTSTKNKKVVKNSL